MKEERERLFEELRYLQTDMHHRGEGTWIVNSILITGSLIVAFQAKSEIFPPPIASLTLILLSFILSGTTDVIDEKYFARIDEIEKELGLALPFHSKIEGKWWYILRKDSKYLLFLSLSAIYFFLAYPKELILSWIIFLTGLLILAFKEERAFTKREIRKSKQ